VTPSTIDADGDSARWYGRVSGTGSNGIDSKMLHKDTDFVRSLAKLKPPSAADYSQADWDVAYAASTKTVSDARIYEAAKWLAPEAAAGRISFANPDLAALSAKWSTILAVAAHNREYRTAVELATDEQKRAREAGVLADNALAALRLEGVAGQRLRAADFAQTGADITENWLFDASNATGICEPTRDLAPAALAATLGYSFRKALNSLWNEAWWAGWYFEVDTSGTTRWLPGDREFERLIQAWGMRQETNLMNYPNVDRMCWPKITPDRRRELARTRGVIEVIKTKHKLRFKVASLNYVSRYMPAYKYEKSALDGCYLADFVDSAMPLQPGITVSRLLLAWHIIYDIAKLLTKQAPLLTSLNAEQARKLALTVGRSALCEAVEQGLRVTRDEADALVTFLTFQFQTGGTAKAKGNKGLWAAPLVPVPGTDEMVLPLSVLATSNPARRAEAWLEKGGIDDSNPVANRGDLYEELYRRRVCDAVRGNAVLKQAACAEREVKKSKSFPEQVDLLVSLGGLCLVGEVKFFLMPVDPQERERYDDKLRKAATQVKRKLAAIQTHRDILALALGIDVAVAKRLKLIPIVVTAQGYRFSTTVDDVLIVEAEFLRTYLAGGDLAIDMALIPATGKSVRRTMTFYQSEEEAADRFESTIESPYVLKRFLDRITWTNTPFPALAHSNTVIEMPVINDVSGFERFQVEAMAADLK
jgi:hypothetical protein